MRDEGVSHEGYVFPAGAGMNRLNPPSFPNLERVPRRRGDEPFEVRKEEGSNMCSPQARG